LEFRHAGAADMRAAIFINHVFDNVLRYAAIDIPSLRPALSSVRRAGAAGALSSSVRE
jgi:hypothetical protein